MAEGRSVDFLRERQNPSLPTWESGRECMKPHLPVFALALQRHTQGLSTTPPCWRAVNEGRVQTPGLRIPAGGEGAAIGTWQSIAQVPSAVSTPPTPVPAYRSLYTIQASPCPVRAKVVHPPPLPCNLPARLTCSVPGQLLALMTKCIPSAASPAAPRLLNGSYQGAPFRLDISYGNRDARAGVDGVWLLSSGILRVICCCRVDSPTR